jgi:hypothetical protein
MERNAARKDVGLARGRSQARARRGLAVAGALMLASGLAAPALGQNVLDRNLQRGSGGLNPRGSDLAAELRFRNAVVTGNAPGGLSFRGNVGYRAPGEFTGLAGADQTTFAFRRDTVYSGLGGLGIRGTDAIQYQFAMTTGMAPPAGFWNLPGGVPRTGAASTSGVIRAEATDLRADEGFAQLPPRWGAGDSAADVRGTSIAAMRAPSAFTATRGLQPTWLGTTFGADGQPLQVTASVLRGVTYGPVTAGRELDRTTEPVPSPAELAGLRPPPGADLAGDQRIRLGADAPPPTPYEQLLDRMRGLETRDIDREDPAGVTRVPGAPDVRGGESGADWRNRMGDLRLRLQEPVAAERGRIATRIDPRVDPRLAPTPDPAAEMMRRQRELAPETIDMLRRAGQIDILAPQGFDAYAVHMQSAQQHLTAGRFFDAEERFTAALSARPGDPMAAIGRVHAALGAGMFLSAAINLRELLIANPELAGARYAPELLPSPERLESVKERLVELLESRPAQARENGLLLAYIGYQTRNRATMEGGLAAMAMPPADGEPMAAADEQMVRLAEILREVWREGGAPQPQR